VLGAGDLNLSSNLIGDAGTESLSGVLAQCPARMSDMLYTDSVAGRRDPGERQFDYL